MYDAFDYFLGIETWHTPHPLDQQRFFKALHRVVHDPAFNADDLATYMRAKINNPALDDTIDHYRDKAWAVREYLEANKLI